MHAAVPVCIPKAVRAAAAEKLASKLHKAADHSGYTVVTWNCVSGWEHGTLLCHHIKLDS